MQPWNALSASLNALSLRADSALERGDQLLELLRRALASCAPRGMRLEDLAKIQ